MQGKKTYQEKFFVNFHLSKHVPSSNFYRRLKESLDLEYLRDLTKIYYGTEGHKSIDPVVFFKLMLVGYLENINSDRKIIEQCSLRLDVLYFLGYDIDEELPWHSTLSRTRKLFGEEVFLGFFRDILRLCVEKGMVNGQSQAVDSAFIKANASLDSVTEKKLAEKSILYFDEIKRNEEEAPSKSDSSNIKNSYNALNVSRTDPESRLSYKRHKPMSLNHLGIISVDTQSHVICGATVDYADRKDSQTVEKIVGQTIENLNENGIEVKEVLADTNYSSGEAYKYLESQNIEAYIPAMGSYKRHREGFAYNKEEDCYVCIQGAKLTFRGITKTKNIKITGRSYYSSAKDCRHCPLRAQCCKNKNHKRLDHSSDRQYYDDACERIGTANGKLKMRVRSATVEPVLGTLLNFRKMKKVYTIGQELARKQILMAAAAYNLKKLMGSIGLKGIKQAASAVKAALLSRICAMNKFILINNKIFAIQ